MNTSLRDPAGTVGDGNGTLMAFRLAAAGQTVATSRSSPVDIRSWSSRPAK